MVDNGDADLTEQRLSCDNLLQNKRSTRVLPVKCFQCETAAVGNVWFAFKVY